MSSELRRNNRNAVNLFIEMRKNLVVRVIFICSMVMLVSCGDSVESEREITNPSVILFDKTREANTQETLNKFINEYNAKDKILSIKRDSITSFLTEMYFDKGVKIFNTDKLDLANPNTKSMFIDFFKRWEKLFGTNLDIAGKKSNGYASDYLGQISFTVFQYELNNKSMQFASSPTCNMLFNYDGTIAKIQSFLIPEFPLPEFVEADSVKIMENILNKSIRMNLNGYYEIENYFDDSYTYRIEKSNAVYFEKHVGKYLLYSLTAVRAYQPLLYGGYPIYFIYCHPATSKVITGRVIPGR
jgi:hypothetical protein